MGHTTRFFRMNNTRMPNKTRTPNFRMNANGVRSNERS